jgi:hypothetical protein
VKTEPRLLPNCKTQPSVKPLPSLLVLAILFLNVALVAPNDTNSFLQD